MKQIRLAALLLAVLLLCGCETQTGPREASISVLPYSPSGARAIIDEAEWYIAWLQSRDTITREQAENFIDRFGAALDPQEAENVLFTAIDAAPWADASVTEFMVLHEFMCPTLYHQGVALISASDTARCQMADGANECHDHHSRLAIHKEYRGDSPLLKGWYLEYIYEQNEHNGPWHFLTWSGHFSMPVQLPLTEDFADAPYPAP